MLASFGYRKHQSLIEELDPRARWIFSILFLFAIVLFWDVRVLAFFFVIAIVQFFLSKLTWTETRRAWLVIFFLATMMILVNTIITSAGTISGVISGGSSLIHFVIQIPWVGWVIDYTLTVERAWFALAQYLRVLAIAAIFLIVPFTMDPRLYGVTFRGILFSDRLAFTMDLAFRFIPTLSRDFQITLDAQRARGFEIEKVEGGVIARIRRIAPLLVPVTMNSILTGEDIANAMDLRCFGLMRRTWVEALKYHWKDYVLMGFGAFLFIGGLILRFHFGVGNFWFPGMG